MNKGIKIAIGVLGGLVATGLGAIVITKKRNGKKEQE